MPTTAEVTNDKKKCWNYFLYGNVFSKIIKSSWTREREERIHFAGNTLERAHGEWKKRELHGKTSTTENEQQQKGNKQ